jgi:hypothetical protein
MWRGVEFVAETFFSRALYLSSSLSHKIVYFLLKAYGNARQTKIVPL